MCQGSIADGNLRVFFNPKQGENNYNNCINCKYPNLPYNKIKSRFPTVYQLSPLA